MFILFYGYNESMMNDTNNSNNTCGTCGRPFPQTTDSKCNYNNCCLSEYKYTMPACIKKKEPDCMAKAVIPAITVDSVDGITNLANCFVHVTSINTTYYIDDKHRPLLVWVGDVEVQLPKGISTDEQIMEFVKSYNLRGQKLYIKMFDSSDGMNYVEEFYFDKNGMIYFVGKHQELKELV